MSSLPPASFESRHFLAAHVDDTLRFYERSAYDPEGGFFHYFLDDGTVYNRGHRHLVSATRFVFNWCQAWRHTGRSIYKDWAAHALAHLNVFRLPPGTGAGCMPGPCRTVGWKTSAPWPTARPSFCWPKAMRTWPGWSASKM